MKFVFLFLVSSLVINAQDSVYTREVIKFLTSEKCYGRGYVNNGLKEATKYITKELKTHKALPLFGSSYLQAYTFPVNTFPKKVEVTVNGSTLTPGRDFIIDPSCPSTKGSFKMKNKDSTGYIERDGSKNCIINFSKKLTWSVSGNQSPSCVIQILRSRITGDVKTCDVNIQAKLIPEFKATNIGCYIEGENNDSMIVLTAHYDHLGAMGKGCLFPGANDNASGTSMVLNFVKYFSQHKPKYKTVFIFFSGEEIGLLGSKYFSEHPAIDLKKIKFLVNLDLLGTGDDGMMVVNGAVFNKQFELLGKINTEKQLVKDIRKRGKAQNSDHYWFTEKGVPSFFIYTLGGVSFYHDIDDVEKTLPLTDYNDVFKLLVEFTNQL